MCGGYIRSAQNDTHFSFCFAHSPAQPKSGVRSMETHHLQLPRRRAAHGHPLAHHQVLCWGWEWRWRAGGGPGLGTWSSAPLPHRQQ